MNLVTVYTGEIGITYFDMNEVVIGKSLCRTRYPITDVKEMYTTPDSANPTLVHFQSG